MLQGLGGKSVGGEHHRWKPQVDRGIEQIEPPDAHDIENNSIIGPGPKEVIAGLVVRRPVKNQPGVVIQEILEGERHSIWVLGARRLGKTSLLKEVEHRVQRSRETPYVALYWDLQGSGDARGLAETLLFAGGVYHVLLIVFHLGFRRIFRWDADLAKLTFLNRQIMPVLNLCLTAVFAMLAVLSLAYPAELAATPMGRCTSTPASSWS